MIRIDAEVQDMDLIDLNDTLPVLEQEIKQWLLFIDGSKDDKFFEFGWWKSSRIKN